MEQAREINEELDDKPGLIFILRQLGNAFFGSDKFEDAIAYHEQSISLAREIEDLTSAGYGLNSLALTYHFLQEYDEAIAYYQEALEIAVAADDSLGEAMTTSNIGWVNVEMGDFEGAKQKAETALKITIEAGSRSLAASNWALLARISVETGQYSSSPKYIYNSITLNRELNDESGMVYDILLFSWREGIVGDLGRSFGWLGMVRTHRSYSRAYLKRFVDRVQTQIRADLSDDEIESLMIQGTELKLKDVVEEIIIEIGELKEDN